MSSQPLHFPEQRSGEHVVVLVRPHWLALLREIVLGFFLVIIPVGILIALSAGEGEPFGPSARPFTVILLPTYYLALVTWLFIRWIDYYLDVGIVTDQRIVDIDQKGLFRRNTAELDLSVVQDVAGERNGLLQTFFDFGDVNVQTAGERPNFTFHAVPHPNDIATKIGEFYNKFGDELSDDAGEQLKEAAAAMKDAAEHMEQSGNDVAPRQSKSAEPEPPRTPPTAPQSPSSTQTGQSQTGSPSKGNQDDQDLPREYEK